MLAHCLAHLCCASLRLSRLLTPSSLRTPFSLHVLHVRLPLGAQFSAVQACYCWPRAYCRYHVASTGPSTACCICVPDRVAELLYPQVFEGPDLPAQVLSWLQLDCHCACLARMVTLPKHTCTDPVYMSEPSRCTPPDVQNWYPFVHNKIW